MRFLGCRQNDNSLNVAVCICFLIARSDALFVGEVKNISQCFVEALVIRTNEVSNDVNYHLEQVTGTNKGAVGSIEEAFKKQVKHFVAEYVFFFMEIEQRFHDCEDRLDGMRCAHDIARDLSIRMVPIAAARLTQIMGGINQAVKVLHQDATATFIDLLENSRNFSRDLLSSTTRCIYKQ